jgi:hypothetical protein
MPSLLPTVVAGYKQPEETACPPSSYGGMRDDSPFHCQDASRTLMGRGRGG